MTRTHKRRGWPVPRAGSLDVTCPAPTSTPGQSFSLALNGAWEEIFSPRPHHSPEAVAADHALAIARNVTATYSAADATAAAARINTVLGQPNDVPRLPVRLVWARVHIVADHQAVRAAVSYQNLLHDQEQRRTELSRRLEEARVLQATLMKDPSLAVAYWFAVAPQSLDADTLDRLEGLFAKVAAYAPQGTWAPLARLLHDFTERLTDEAKSHLIATLGAIADRYGQPEIAEEIHALQDNSSDTFPSQ